MGADRTTEVVPDMVRWRAPDQTRSRTRWKTGIVKPIEIINEPDIGVFCVPDSYVIQLDARVTVAKVIDHARAQYPRMAGCHSAVARCRGPYWVASKIRWFLGDPYRPAAWHERTGSDCCPR